MLLSCISSLLFNVFTNEFLPEEYREIVILFLIVTGKCMADEKKIMISGESFGELEAVIIDKNPKTSQAIMDALPFEGSAIVWGEEIYFEIPVDSDEENGQQDMEVGDIAYWPVGKAMCIFFGPTPVSESEKPRAYSAVYLFARVAGDARILKRVQEGETIGVKCL
jgi:hypothetical protein